MSNSASSSRIMRRLTTLFPSEYLEEHAEELGVVERGGSCRFPSSYGRSCSASPQARAEHSLASDAATTRQLTRRSLRAASIIG